MANVEWENTILESNGNYTKQKAQLVEKKKNDPCCAMPNSQFF